MLMLCSALMWRACSVHGRQPPCKAHSCTPRRHERKALHQVGLHCVGADLAGWEACCQPDCAGLESLDLVAQQDCPQEIPDQAR